AVRHGYNYKTAEQLKPSFWRELKEGFDWQVIEGVKLLGRGVVGAIKENARRTEEIMEEAHDRGLPMNPIGASMAAGVTETIEGISDNIEACKADLVRAVEAETKTDIAIAALQATVHMGQAALGAYSLAEPIGSFPEGGIGGSGMSVAVANDGSAA